MCVFRLTLFFALVNLSVLVEGFSQELTWFGKSMVVDKSESSDDFPIADAKQSMAAIRYDAVNESHGVIRAIGDLRNHIDSVTGVKPPLSTNEASFGYEIVIGTVGNSKLIDQLVSSKKLDVKNTKGRWEGFVIETIKNPKQGVKQCLVIAGSDKRGTICG